MVNLNVVLTRVCRGILLHVHLFLFPYKWRIQSLISKRIYTLVSSCVAFYLVYMCLEFSCLLMKFCKRYLYEVWHFLQTTSTLVYKVIVHTQVLEGSYKSS